MSIKTAIDRESEKALPFWRQIRWRLMLFFVLLAVVPIGAVVAVALRQTSTQAQIQVLNQLESVSTLKANQAASWLEQTNATVELIAADPDLQIELADSLADPMTTSFDAVSQELSAFEEVHPDIASLFVYDTRGQIVASSHSFQVGRSVASEPYFIESLQEQHYVHTPYYNSQQELQTAITHAIRTESGEIVGVLVAQPEISRLADIMEERTGLGDAGETYLVSRSNNYLLTPVRTAGYTPLRPYHTLGIDAVLREENGWAIYNNYQSPPVQVIGVYRWVPTLNAGLVAEMPYSQVQAASISARNASRTVAILSGLAAVVLGYLIVSSITNPIIGLTRVATRIARGDLNTRATVRANNEIGVLATSFNSMADQLEGMVTSLEERVQDRTRDLSVAADVSREIASALDLAELLPRVVELTKDRFHLYHAHIYLLDDSRQNLNMEAGAGEVGEMMKAMGHSIPLDAERSLVARAARTAQPVIANNVTAVPDHLPNPLLPDTRSEMAVPLILGSTVIGVLDIQSVQVNRFGAQDADVLSTLAGQIAVAVQNARLFEQTGRSERLLRSVIDASTDWIWVKDTQYNWILLNQAFADQALGVPPEQALGKSDADFFPPDLVNGNPDMGIRGTRDYDREALAGNIVQNPNVVVRLKDGTQRIVDTRQSPIFDAQGKVIGTLGVSRDITEQETARRRQRTAYELGERLNSLLSADQLLSETVNRLGETFRYYHAHIYLSDEPNRLLVVREGLGEAGATLKELGHNIPIDTERSLVARAARQLTPVVVNDVAANPDHLPNPLLPDTLSEVALPLYTGDHLIGVLDVQHNVANHFTEDEVRTLRIIAGQLSVALSNAQLFEEAQNALLETALLYASSEAITRSASFEDLMNALASSTPLAKFDRATISLFDRPWVGDRSPAVIRVYGAWERSGDAPRDPVGTTYSIEQVPYLDAIARDEPSYFADVATDPRVDDFTRNLFVDRLQVRSVAIFPLTVGPQWLGVVIGQSAETVPLPDSEVRHVATVADHAATVVQNLLLFREAQTRLAETTALQARLQAIIDAASSAIISFGDDQGLLVFNHVAEEVFGYTADEARRLGLDAFIVDFSKVIKSAAARRARALLEVTGRRKNGDEFPAEVSISWITLEGKPVVTIVLSDISDRRRVERRERLAYELGQDLTILFSPDLLLRETIEHLHAGLGYYHAHVYLHDAERDVLYVREGLGEAGRMLKDMGHSIPLQAERSLVARAARSVEVVVVNNVYENADHLPNPLLPETRSEVALPLYSGDRLIGVLDVQHNVLDYFTEPEVRTLRIVANQLTIALANAQLYQEQLEARARMEQSNRELALLNRVIDAASSTLNKTDMLKLVCYELAQAFNVPQAAATLVNEERTHFEVVAEYLGAGRPSAIGDMIPIEGSPISEIFMQEKRPIVVEDVRTDPRMVAIRDIMERRGTYALLLVPFMIGGEVVGSIGVDSLEPRRFLDADIRLASQVAATTSQALYNALLYETQLEHAERLREVDRLKSEFLANMSHELRTPLNSIIGYSELLIDEVGPQIDPMSFDDLKAIHSSGQHLLSIINDVLDLAKIEAGRLELNRANTNFSELALQIIESAKVLVKDKPDVQLELDLADSLPTIYADKVRLRQIIWNLLSNAIKFTEEGFVRLGARRENGSLVISVEDSGIGIAPQYHSIIFDQFRQADGSSTRKAGGTGLGLAITRQLVRLHGGDIWVESEQGKGSIFRFTLPLDAGSRPEHPAGIPAAQATGD